MLRLLVALALVISCTGARAVDALLDVTPVVTPAFHTAGFRVVVQGDEDADITALLAYRITGAADWRPAQPLVRIAGNRFAGTLFHLTEGTAYEARIFLNDPDGGSRTLTVSFRTRATPAHGTGRVIWVSPEAGGGADGSPERPFRTIQAGVNAAQPGDIVSVLPGIYRESVRVFFKSGLPDAPITIRAAVPGVCLRGCSSLYEKPQTRGTWRLESDGLYSTLLPSMTGYVAADGNRLFHSGSLRALVGGQTGWWQDPRSLRLYVRLPNGKSVSATPLQIAELREGFRFDGASDYIVEGFDIGFYGTDFGHGVYIRESSRITVRNCRIHNMLAPVFTKGVSNGNLIENCDISDPGMESWPWEDIKGTDAEGVGIWITGGRGNVVRNNRVTGVFNGIAVTTFDSEDDGDTDVYGNRVCDVGDDGLEPEGACVNDRFHGNTVRNCRNSVSLAPITVGPVWLLYNTLSEHRESGLKVSNKTSGPVLMYHNTVVVTRAGVNALSPWSPMKGFVLRNNILYGTRYVLEDYWGLGPDMDWDALFTTDVNRFIKWADVPYAALAGFQEVTGQEPYGVQGDPLFQDVANGDYRLRADSPALAKGLILDNINDDWGQSPNIGTWQVPAERPKAPKPARSEVSERMDQ